MNEMQEYRAKLAYDTYCKSIGGVAFNGDELPVWEIVPERIQLAWAVSAKAVADFTRRRIIERLQTE